MSNPEQLMKIVYISDNEIGSDLEKLSIEIDSILSAARVNNPRAGVSGALIFNTENFAQVLEGPQALLEAAFSKIQCDMRHSNVIVLNYEPIEERTFGSWAMAYVGATDEVAQSFSELCSQPHEDQEKLIGEEIHSLLYRHADSA